MRDDPQCEGGAVRVRGGGAVAHLANCANHTAWHTALGIDGSIAIP